MWEWVEHVAVGGACCGRWSMWGWVEHVGVGGTCGVGGACVGGVVVE